MNPDGTRTEAESAIAQGRTKETARLRSEWDGTAEHLEQLAQQLVQPEAADPEPTVEDADPVSDDFETSSFDFPTS